MELCYAYGLDKWTVKQLFYHIIDTERVMSFKALNALRGQSKDKIPGMEQDLFAKNASIDERTSEELLEEFKAVRASTKYLFKEVTEEQSKRTAFVLGENTSTRSLAFMTISHAIQHVNVLK